MADPFDYESKFAEIAWIEAAANPWGVPLLDLRPVTQYFVSASKNSDCASNAISFSGDDGTSFIGDSPSLTSVVPAQLRFRVDRLLADGVLFTPKQMEHKWAIFYHQARLICVRSWTRKVQVIAETNQNEEEITLCSITGGFTEADEEPELTVRLMNYLLRSHVLNQDFPVPLPTFLAQDPRQAASWCFSLFGNRALFATPHEISDEVPEQPLRTASLLHIPLRRG